MSPTAPQHHEHRPNAQLPARHRHQPEGSPPSRLRRLAGGSLLLGLLLTLTGLVLLTGFAAEQAWTGPGGFDRARPDDELTALAAASATALLGWLWIGTTLTTLACLRLPARMRRVAVACSVLAPSTVRRAVPALLGASVLTSLAFPATAAEAPASISVVQPDEFDPSWATTRTPTRPPTAGPSGTPPPAPSGTPTGKAGRQDRPPPEVVVRRGDTLWGLASRRLGPEAGAAAVTTEWHGWFRANREVIGPEPDMLRAGQRLRVPPHRANARWDLRSENPVTPTRQQ